MKVSMGKNEENEKLQLGDHSQNTTTLRFSMGKNEENEELQLRDHPQNTTTL